MVTVFALDGGQVLHQNAASVRFYGTRCLDTAFRPLNQHFAAVGDISRRGSQPGQDNVLSQLFVLEPDKLHRMLRAVAAAAAPPAQPGNTPPGPPRWKGGHRQRRQQLHFLNTGIDALSETTCGASVRRRAVVEGSAK